MLDFKIKKLDNLKFSQDELFDYYNTVIRDFQHLKWTPPKHMDTLTHDVSTMYSYAAQSNLKDPNIPCPPYHIDDGNERTPDNDFSVATPLLFGFAKKIVDTMPSIRQTGIACHPPGTRIDLHADNDYFLKIHIPIVTNDNAWFFFKTDRFNLEAGSAYMVNTALLHGTSNMGNTDRIHLLFKFPYHLADTILNTEYTL